MIQQVRQVPGVAGVHVMAYRQGTSPRSSTSPACCKAARPGGAISCRKSRLWRAWVGDDVAVGPSLQTLSRKLARVCRPSPATAGEGGAKRRMRALASPLPAPLFRANASLSSQEGLS
jgi:hypothetical protein